MPGLSHSMDHTNAWTKMSLLEDIPQHSPVSLFFLKYPVAMCVAQVCTKCKEDKDASNFHRNTLTVSGLVARCKQCIAETDAARCA